MNCRNLFTTVFTLSHELKTMILVSYIDILDFVGDDRVCLIEGEELFNENRVTNVQVLRRSSEECYDVSALCQDTSHSRNVNVCINIDQNKKKSLTSKCTCASGGRCGHVAAILIYLHRNLPCNPAESPPKSHISVNAEKKTGNNSSIKEDHIGKEPEDQYRRKLRHKRSVTAAGTTSRDESKPVIIKAASFDKTEANVDIDDPTWDKENDGEDDEAFDFSPSSDDDWKPSPEKKRPRREISLYSSENPKDVPKARKKKLHTSKPEVDQKGKLSNSAIQDDNELYKCHLCDLLLEKEEDLRNHLKNTHLLKKDIFPCNKCKRAFKSCRTLKAHETSCDIDCREEEDNECDTPTTGTQTQKTTLAAPLEEEEEEEGILMMEPLQCLLCEVAADTRREMHDHYILAHRTHKRDTVSVCDRCGEFRLPRDHICPSQLSFRCRMCRVSFKAGRDYWNHLIRLSKAHAFKAKDRDRDCWRCGWPRCAERFPAEEELMTHVRLHLPQHAAHMCTICGLLLRNADAKVAHLAKHDSGVYECDACAHACADKEALRQHWDEHADERPHRCDECGWRFVSDALLQVHARKVHEGGPFSCAKCPSTFSDRTDVRVHFGAAHGKLRCPQSSCSFRCTSKASLRRHDALAHAHMDADVDDDFNQDDPPVLTETASSNAKTGGDDAPLSLPCPTPKCEETFAKRAELRAHVRDSHDGVPVACPECSKPFRSRRALDEHVRTHTGEKPFICAECGMTFKRAQNLEHHTKGAHKNERNFSCPECAKRFISNADMQRHLRYSHQGGKKWHLCTHCGHKAPSLYNLKQHVQSRHTGERPHKCQLCEAGFVARADLKKHVMYKHNKEQPFACPDCDRRYQRRRDLQLHQQRHHAGGSHACAECGKDFDSYASMMQHARYHTSEEAFQCAKCGRRFPHRMNLSRHLCTPDIKKNFRCDTCGLSFTTSGSLKSHRRRLHSAEDAADVGKPKAKQARQAGEQQQQHQQQHQQQQQQQQQQVQPVEQALEAQQPQPPLEQPQSLPQTSPPPAQYLPSTPQAAQAPVIHHGALHHQQLHPRHYEPQQQHASRPVTHRLPQLAPQPAHEAVLQIRQHVVVHQPRHHQEEEQQHIATHPHPHQQHVALEEVHEAVHEAVPEPVHDAVHEAVHDHVHDARYEDYAKDSSKLWRGVAQDTWAMNPAVATTAALAQDDTILTLTTCSTYHELESAATHSAAPAMQLMATMHAPHVPSPPSAAAHTPPPPPLVVQQSNVLRYSAMPPPGTLVVKAAAPPPLVSLQVKADHHQMMYAHPPAAPTACPSLKLVSVSQSQPPPLASLSSSTAQGQILGAPIQTTADGSIHLVFVPAPTK